MRALVTGGAGFIGSRLVEQLVDEGAEAVLVLDDLSSGSEENLAGVAGVVDLERFSIDDPKAGELIAGFAPEVVFHLAAQPSVVVSVRDPLLDARINVLGTISVCQAAAGAAARKIVFASSGGTVYGEPDPTDLPVDESYAGTPTSPYGITKKVVHDYLAFFKAVHGLDYTALALSNVYGPRQDPHGEAGVVAIWSRRMLAGDECLLFGDGEQTRDFVYVADVADAFARAATRGDGELINIGTAVQTTVNELYATIAKSLSVDRPAHYEPARAGELRHIALDVSKAKQMLDWEPRTPLAEGIPLTTAWFAERAAMKS